MTDFLFDPQVLAVSVGIVLLSFISEDAAAVSSALLVLGGPVAWPVGFASCFLGIWIGDLAIYSAARWGGRPFLKSRWLAQRIDSCAIDQLEREFSHRVGATLFVSRFIPGTRVITYVAAGLLSTPLLGFAALTGGAVFVWVSTIFGLAKLLGASAPTWLVTTHSRVGSIAAVAVCIVGAIMLLRTRIAGIDNSDRLAKGLSRPGRNPWFRLQLFVRRWKHWEFWPAWLFYLPVAVHYCWLGLRYRSFTLPSAANPVIPTGGLVGESKCAIIDLLRERNPELVADAYLVRGAGSTERILSLQNILQERRIPFPFILKPDFGQRGNGVRLIRSLPAAMEYLEKVTAPVMVQRYAPGPREVGVFYYRMPNERRGRIFTLTEKIFPRVTGDGCHTIEELIFADRRASLIARRYLRRFAARRDEVLAAGEVLRLVESGNHAQGCIFRDGEHLRTPELEDAIDCISQVRGFYIGRYDIRYASEAELRRGKNFQIVELNGAASEATNIYDARNSLGKAYRTLFAQWRLVFAIGNINRCRSVETISLHELWREWRKYSRASLCYPLAD